MGDPVAPEALQMLGVPSGGVPLGGLLCSKGGLEEKKQVIADSQAPGGSLLPPCFHVSPGSSTVGPIVKACCPLAKTCKHSYFLFDPPITRSFLLLISEHIEKPSTSTSNTFLSCPVPCHCHLCPSLCQPSSDLPEALSTLSGPGLMLRLIFL